VQQHTQAAAQQAQRQLVIGYTTVETLKQVARTLLDKPGGYLSNDIAPPGLWLDNMPSWEYGALVQVRDLARALRKDFARSQSQSTEDPDLAKAEPLFNFDNNSWALPPSEGEYRQGIRALDRYLARLSDPAQTHALFYTRADNLNNWLGDVATRLGSLSQRLSASIGRVRLNADLENTGAGQSLQLSEDIVETPWLCSTKRAVRRGRCHTCCAPSKWILPTCWPRRTRPSVCGRSFVSSKPLRKPSGVRWCSTAAAMACWPTTHWSWPTTSHEPMPQSSIYANCLARGNDVD
jgi:hypothetical protein